MWVFGEGNCTCTLTNPEHSLAVQKEGPDEAPTKSAHPARFSPDDKFSRERITLKKRFGILPTQLPPKEYWFGRARPCTCPEATRHHNFGLSSRHWLDRIVQKIPRHNDCIYKKKKKKSRSDGPHFIFNLAWVESDVCVSQKPSSSIDVHTLSCQTWSNLCFCM